MFNLLDWYSVFRCDYLSKSFIYLSVICDRKGATFFCLRIKVFVRLNRGRNRSWFQSDRLALVYFSTRCTEFCVEFNKLCFGSISPTFVLKWIYCFDMVSQLETRRVIFFLFKKYSVLLLLIHDSTSSTFVWVFHLVKSNRSSDIFF